MRHELVRHELVVNGLDGPMRKLLGCSCGRCMSPGRQANTSASLLSYEGETLVHHLLIDAGAGVADSLLANPSLRGERARLDGILLTHWHPDHTINLNQLVVSYRIALRNRGVVSTEEMPRIPIWCRRTSAEHLKLTHAYDFKRLWDPRIDEDNAPPGHILAPVELAPDGVDIIPVTVSHFSADQHPTDSSADFYACAGFVLKTAQKKALLLWDLDNLNEWLVEPQTAEQMATVQLLSDADHLFVDTAYWHKHIERGTHAGFQHVMRYAHALQPRETLLVHMSGHPDRPGNPGYGWPNSRWQTEACAAWSANACPGTVRVPEIGDIFSL